MTNDWQRCRKEWSFRRRISHVQSRYQCYARSYLTSIPGWESNSRSTLTWDIWNCACCIYQVWLQHELLSHQFAWLLSLPDDQNLKSKEILTSETGCLDWLKTNAWPKACHWKPRTKASHLDGTINGPACDCTNVCKRRTKYIYIHIYIVCTKACDPKKHTIMYSRINILQWFGLP